MEAAVINNTTGPVQNLILSARIFSSKGEELDRREIKLSVEANTVAEGFRIDVPEQAKNSVVFIKLILRDERGQILSDNFYWYAAQPAGYRKLEEMSGAVVDCSASQKTEDGWTRVDVTLTNGSQSIALATEATLRSATTKGRLLPAYQSDNFISLLPGERRSITVEVPASVAGKGEMQVWLTGWNVRAATVPVERARLD
jgi:hypothetical protein